VDASTTYQHSESRAEMRTDSPISTETKTEKRGRKRTQETSLSRSRHHARSKVLRWRRAKTGPVERQHQFVQARQRGCVKYLKTRRSESVGAEANNTKREDTLRYERTTFPINASAMAQAPVMLLLLLLLCVALYLSSAGYSHRQFQ
jgi:hypothetical protein